MDVGKPGHDVAWWDAKHRARGAHGDVDPSVRSAVLPLHPGRGPAVDLACGTGRHARWLARRGWDVTGVDSSPGGVEVARAAAGADGAAQRCRFVVADARTWEPARQVALVVVAFVALPDLVARTAGWLAPRGVVVVVGHAVANAERGTGGPRDPRLLHDPVSLAAAARAAGLRVQVSGEVERPVSFVGEAPGVQVDAVLVAHR